MEMDVLESESKWWSFLSLSDGADLLLLPLFQVYN